MDRPRATSRRTFLAAAAGLVATACAGNGNGDGDASPPSPPSSPPLTPPPRPPAASEPFTLGVASGDPAVDGVVLWTRLTGVGAGVVPLTWEVAADDRFEDVVATGSVLARPDLAHAVHVEVDGLAAATTYWYRFRSEGTTSATGRTRTLPAAPAGRFRFAFASCQRWTDGWYAAHRHLAVDDVDLVLWLGDYIYEDAGGRRGVRRHTGGEARTLEQYRARYALYRSDPDLQAAHAAHPWVAVWDDHEVDDNVAGDEQATRRAAAYRAWYEHMPVRLPVPDGPRYRIHRSLPLGDLATILLLDGRQYRSDQPCERDDDVGRPCGAADSAERTMLGSEQEAWLADEVARSTAVWTVVANQTVLAPTDIGVGPLSVANLDQWDGYPAARRRLLDVLARAPNPVVVTGDVHASIVSDVGRDGETVVTELVGSSISSEFPDRYATVFETATGAAAGNRYVDTRRRGYVRCELTRSGMRADYRLLDDGRDPQAAISTAASVELVAGRRGSQRV